MGLHENRWIDNAVLDDRPIDRVAARPEDASVAMLKRASMLLPDDRLLVEMVLKNRVSYRTLSQMTGLPPGTLCRKLKRLAKRLVSPLAVAITEPRTPLPLEYRQLAIEHFLQGRTARDLADSHQMKRSDVRRALQFVRGWHQGLISQWR